MRILSIIIFTLLISFNQYCEAKNIAVNELHESGGDNIIRHFIEDVISLLPSEFRKHLDEETIRSSVKFIQINGPVRHAAMSERDLTHKYMTISTKYINNTINDMTLSDELGSTIATIVEVSMTHGKHDLMGEKSKKNVDKFLREEYKKTHIVEYDGYDGSDIKTSISRIYELSKYKKSDIYPLMVMRTADLWASIHNSKTKNISKVTKTFIRRPSNIAFTGNYNTTSATDQLNMKSVTDTNESLSNNKSSYNDAGSDQNKSNEPGAAIIFLIPIRQ